MCRKITYAYIESREKFEEFTSQKLISQKNMQGNKKKKVELFPAVRRKSRKLDI